MNWLWLVIGIGVGALGQRWLSRQQRHHYHSRWVEKAPPEKAPPEIVEAAGNPLGANEGKLLWIAYVRALERAQFQGGFLARVAHELRSPLSSLMGLQQLVLADLCDDAEEERQCVAQSYEAAQNLHRLMDQLIRVAKLEQGSQRLDIQPIALDVLLEDVRALVELQVADRNADLQLELPAKPIYVRADYHSLRQILLMWVEAALQQRACEIRLALSPRGTVESRENHQGESGGVTLNLWADQPLFPLAELKAQVQQRAAEPWSQAALSQLKQSLSQKPESSFVPHRLSPGMILVISQMLLDLNAGKLNLVPAPASVTEAGPDDNALDEVAVLGAGESGLEQQPWALDQQPYALELWLPAA